MLHHGQIGALLCLLTCLFVHIAFCDRHNTDMADKKYAGMCEVQFYGEISSSSSSFGLPCQVALFSYYNFDILGSVGVLPEECDLCTQAKICDKASRDVAAVMRGGCSFDTKARNANRIGYSSLIIVNNDPDQDNFPMGSIEKEYQSPIPVVMMHSSSLEYLNKESSQVWMRMKDVKKPFEGVKDIDPNTIRFTILEYAVWLIPGLFVLLIACSHYIPRACGYTVSSVILLGLFFALRQGTYRTDTSLRDGSDSIYHHSETDERIFASLVESVESNWWDYSLLGKGTIERLRLSMDNYGDNIFIHPPIFVYTLVILKKLFGFSLPTTTLGMHGVSLFLTGQLASLHSTRGQAAEAGLAAMVLYSCCPIAAFCSQKVWIDNALAFYCLVVVSLHSSLWTAGGRGQNKYVLIIKCLMSGFLFGLLVLNCKSTGLALLPYLVLSTLPHFSVQGEGEGEDKGEKSAPSLPALVRWTPIIFATMLFGATCAHGPWILLYHHTTGRWVPNAWPSAEMIATNPFIRRAINRPWYFYFGVLLRFSPLLLVGLVCMGFSVKVYLFGGSSPAYGASKVGSRGTEDAKNREESARYAAWQHVTLAIWPISFLVGLSALSIAGAGSQARFLLPAIAPLCALAGTHFASSSAQSVYISPVSALLLVYMGIHLMYYAILFPNLYADLDLSVIELIGRTLRPSSSLANISTKECMDEILAWLRHHGVHVE